MINAINNFSLKTPQTQTLSRQNQIKPDVQSIITNPIKRPKLPQPTTMMALLYNNISFTGHREDLVRSIGHVSCPCCGTKMLTNDDMTKISKDLSKEDTAKHYINTLKPYEEYMHKTEKDVFHRFEKWGQENPENTISDFLSENRDASMDICKNKQADIFKQINSTANSISKDAGEKFENLTKTYSKTPINNEEDMKTIRKYMISDIKTSKRLINNEDKYNELKTLAESLPTSKNDADAFIVRYAGQKSEKIGTRLLKLSVGTIEHVKPQADGGKDRIENYLLECGECNHTRGDVSLKDWVEEHPEMKENTQKYFDEVIEKINNNELSHGLDNYPNAVKGALNTQSQGTLTYDTSALKPKQEETKKANNAEKSEKQGSKNEQVETAQKPHTHKPQKPHKPHPHHHINLAA
ncbi:hypothetical protein IJ818_07115 [bacterium]|nr:hypothetical protein [bacterium]